MITGIIGFVLGIFLTIIIANIKDDTTSPEEDRSDFSKRVEELSKENEKLKSIDKMRKLIIFNQNTRLQELLSENEARKALTEVLEDVKLERDFYKVVLEDYLE